MSNSLGAQKSGWTQTHKPTREVKIKEETSFPVRKSHSSSGVTASIRLRSSPPPFFPREPEDGENTSRALALEHALAPNTLAGYVTTTKRFWDFCESERIPPHDRFPASSHAIARFAASFAGEKSGATAANAMAAIKTWHGAHDLPWCGGAQLSLILRGVSNLAPTSSKRDRRPPVTQEMLRTLHDKLDLKFPFDVAVFAAACVAFWGQCRLGELLGSSRRIHDANRYPSQASILDELSIGSSTHIHLPSTKTSVKRGETIVLPNQRGRSDPIYALAIHLHINKGMLPKAHLFAFHASDGTSTRCLTKEAFIDRCNAVWSQDSATRFTGHCFRIGGTNAFLEAGVPTDVVRMKGRWKSDAFFTYWRNQNRLTAKHTERIVRTGSASYSSSAHAARGGHVGHQRTRITDTSPTEPDARSRPAGGEPPS